jgi:hypothetical protein
MPAQGFANHLDILSRGKPIKRARVSCSFDGEREEMRAVALAWLRERLTHPP